MVKGLRDRVATSTEPSKLMRVAAWLLPTFPGVGRSVLSPRTFLRAWVFCMNAALLIAAA